MDDHRRSVADKPPNLPWLIVSHRIWGRFIISESPMNAKPLVRCGTQVRGDLTSQTILNTAGNMPHVCFTWVKTFCFAQLHGCVSVGMLLMVQGIFRMCHWQAPKNWSYIQVIFYQVGGECWSIGRSLVVFSWSLFWKTSLLDSFLLDEK